MRISHDRHVSGTVIFFDAVELFYPSRCFCFVFAFDRQSALQVFDFKLFPVSAAFSTRVEKHDELHRVFFEVREEGVPENEPPVPPSSDQISAVASRQALRQALSLPSRLFSERALVSYRSQIANIRELAQSEEVLKLLHVSVVRFVILLRIENALKVLLNLLGAAFQLRFFHMAVDWASRESGSFL